MTRKNYINIILIIMWMLLIFSFSNQNGSKSSTVSDSFIIKTAELITQKDFNQKDEEKIVDSCQFIVRKTAHFSLYFILAILVLNLFKDLNYKKKAYLITLIICFLYACSDEIHQLFIADRSGEFRDVLIDTSGGFVYLLLNYLLTKKTLINKETAN